MKKIINTGTSEGLGGFIQDHDKGYVGFFSHPLAGNGIIKYDLHGNILWAKSPTPQLGVLTPFKQKTYLTGVTDPLTGKHAMVRLDSNLNVISALGGYDDGFAQICPDKGYLLYGNGITKTDSLGNIQWRKQYTLAHDMTWLVPLKHGGYAFITNINSLGNPDHAVAGKLDSLGNLQWVKKCNVSYGFTSYDEFQSVGELADGSLVFGGEGTTNSSYSPFLLARFTPSGSLIWAKNYDFLTYQQGFASVRDIIPREDGTFWITVRRICGTICQDYDDYIYLVDPDGNISMSGVFSQNQKSAIGRGVLTDDGYPVYGGSSAPAWSSNSDAYIWKVDKSLCGVGSGFRAAPPSLPMVFSNYSVTVSNLTYSTPAPANVQIGYTNKYLADSLVCYSCPEVTQAGFTMSNVGGTVTFNNTSVGAYKYRWNFGDGTISGQENPTHTYSVYGTYIVSLTAIGACDTAEKCMPVDFCEFASIDADTLVCLGGSLPLVDISGGSLSHNWYRGGNLVDTTANYNPVFNTLGTEDILLVSSNGLCLDSALVSINVTSSLPVASFTMTVTGTHIDLVNTSQNGSTFSWDFGDGNTSNLLNPTHDYAVGDSFLVCLIANSACGADTTCQWYHCDILNPGFIAFNTGLSVALTDTTSFVISRLWKFGDGTTSTAANPVHTYPSGGIYNICLTVTNSCNTATYCRIINVGQGVSYGYLMNQGNGDEKGVDIQPTPDGGFILLGYKGTTSNHDITLTKVDAGINVQWTKWFETPSNELPVEIVVCPNGDYLIGGKTSLGNFDGFILKTKPNGTQKWFKTFGNSGTDEIFDIDLYPNGDILAAGRLAGVSFLSKVDSVGTPIWTRSYSIYNTSALALPNGGAIFGNGGYEVGVTNSSGVVQNAKGPQWGYLVNYMYRIIPTASGDFVGLFSDGGVGGLRKFDANLNLLWECQYEYGNTEFSDLVEMTDGSVVAVGTDYDQWNFNPNNGDRDFVVMRVGPTGSLVYAKDEGTVFGEYGYGIARAADGSVVMVGTQKQSSQDSDMLIMKTNSSLVYSCSTMTTSGFQTDPETMVSATINSNALAITQTFGSLVPIDTIAQCSSICNTGGCITPISDFTFTISNMDVSFVVTGSGSGTYSWDHGDGTVSGLGDHTHSYANTGTYTVCLTRISSCGNDVKCYTINVVCPVLSTGIQYYTGNGANYSFGAVSNFTPTSWSWDFGDGGTGTGQNVSHVYAAYGQYNVCLTSTGACGTVSHCEIVNVHCPWGTTSVTPYVYGLTVLFAKNNPGIFLIDYDFGDGSPVVQGENLVHTYAAPGTYTVCASMASNCGTDTICFPVTITCNQLLASWYHGFSGLTATFVNQSIGNPTTWSWDFGDGNTSALKNPTHAYAASGTYTVCLIMSDSCSADTLCQTITTGCNTIQSAFGVTGNNLINNFTDNSIGSPVSWLWDFGDGSTSTQQNPSHTYASTGNYNACLTVGNGCVQNTYCNLIQITCAPPVAAMTGCVMQGTGVYNNLSTGATSYLWDFGDGTTSTLANPNHTYANPGVYQVCLIATNSCGSDTTCGPFSAPCVAPNAAFNMLIGNNQVFLYNSTTGPPANLLWDFGDGNTSTQTNPVHTYPTAGTYTICLTSSNSCGSNTVCIPITTYISCPTFTPTITYNGPPNPTACDVISLTASSGYSGYSWNFGQNTQTIVPSFAGTYTVTVTDGNGCPGTASYVLNLDSAVQASFGQSLTFLQASFTDQSAGNPTSWQWDFGDGNTSILQNPTHNYATAGTYTVCLIGSNQCSSDTSCQTVSIVCPIPATAFAASSTNYNASFTDQSTGTPTSWGWNFGDGQTSVLQNPSHTYAATGTYTVCLITGNPCGADTTCQQVTITCPQTSSGFSASSTNYNATFTDQSTGSPTTWSWNFGDGQTSTLQNPTHTYAATGNYTVCLTTTNACGSNSNCQTITITCPTPTAAFASSVNNFTATFNNQTTGSPTSVSWDFGDGFTSTQSSPSHIYAANGTYQVCLTATNGCGPSTVCHTITVNCPAPTASFGETVTNLTAVFSNSSTGGTSYSWNFGDGGTATSTNPVHTYAAQGTYTVCLTVTNVCGQVSSCHTVSIVCPPPVAGFTSSVNQMSASFTDQSTGATTWSWNFGDGGTSNVQNPVHTYSGPGTYNVCLTVNSACGTQTTCQTVTITCPSPVAAFTFNANGLTVSFTDQSTGGTTWSWNFGDGIQSTQQNPNHTYLTSGTFQVCLTVGNGCLTSTSCVNVTVVCQPPVAGFTYTVSGNSVNFIDLSSGNPLPTSWSWNFGDGSVSTQQNPVHNYAFVSTYVVCQTAISACGTNTDCQTITNVDLESGVENGILVYPNPASDRVFVELLQPSGELVELTLLDLPGKILDRKSLMPGQLKSEFDLTPWAQGTYLIQIRSGGQVEVHKLIIAGN
ncbi:MAG: PKD domain-containing protein [Bacteroidia bacterium]|nr:PKD domain-containing protein [Bacteroidia bacterium]